MGGHAQVDGRDLERAHRHWPRPGRRVRPDDVLPRIDRRHLPTVLRNRDRVHAAVGGGRPRALTRAVRLAAPARREGARSRGDRLQALPAVLPLVRLHVLSLAGRVRARRRPHPETKAALRAHLRRHRGRPGGALFTDADRVPAGRGPGLADGHRAASGWLDPRADTSGTRGDEGLFRQGGARCRRGLPGHSRYRPGWAGTEPGTGVRQAPRLGSETEAGPAGEGGCRPRDGSALAPQAGEHLHRAAAARHRARQRDGLRLYAAGPRRARPRPALAGARPVARHGGPRSAPGARAAERHAGCAPVQGGHRLGAGRDAWRPGERRPELSRDGLWRIRTSTTSSRAAG